MRPKLTKKMSKPGLVLRFNALATSSKIALSFLLVVVLMAVFAPLLTSYSPIEYFEPSVAPSGDHWFGTDAVGADVFARIAYGARNSLIIGLAATAVALAAAAVLGSIAATGGKVTSELLMRTLDIIMSFPGIALAAVFVAVFGNSLPVLIITIGFLYMPQLTRVVRANILAQFGEDYVSASKVMGASVSWILIKHVTRNIIAPIMVFATVLVADAIVFEASLSFINAGIQAPEPSWGNILSDNKVMLYRGEWWTTVFPGVMILLTVLALNILSEGLTDAMVSPKLRRKVDVEADEQAMRGETDEGITRSYTTQAQSLAQRLDSLRQAEQARGDRLVYEHPESQPLLEVKNLCISFPEAHGEVNIVDNVSFSVRPGETMGLVGESGCGKSISSMAIMGLLPKTARISGELIFDGQNVLEMTAKEHNALRGRGMAMIYQDALSSLNPSMLIRSQMAQLTKRGGTRTAEDLLELVGLDPVRTLKSYPHELSGGQRQRVLIAMALTRDPKLVIADEPTTALDVTVQAQVVDLLNELREKLGFAMVFVSHDLALVAQMAHRITVMYAGQVVEQAETAELMSNPQHEYTRGLLGAVLSIESGSGRLHQVPGTVPSPREFVVGDRFAPRSSHPRVGLDTPVVTRTLPGTTHHYAIHPDLEKILEKEAQQ